MSGETSYDSYFTTPAGHTGVTFVASSGDSGSSGARVRLGLAQRARRRRHAAEHR